MHAWQRRFIEEIRRWILYCGNLCHSSANACASCPLVRGGAGLFLSLLSKASHMFSIGFKSGLLDGHGSIWTLLLLRCWIVALAVCGRAPSCMKIVPGFLFKNGSTCSDKEMSVGWHGDPFNIAHYVTLATRFNKDRRCDMVKSCKMKNKGDHP